MRLLSLKPAPLPMRCILPVLCTVLAATGAARAQDEGGRDPDWARSVAAAALFDLRVTGTLKAADGQGPRPEERHGKAFAIGPNLLLTSNHVLGDWSEWAAAEEDRKEVARAVRPIDRHIAMLTADSDPDRPIADPVVIPPFSPSVDAATLLVPSLDLPSGAVFRLSLCALTKGESYAALLVGGDPRDAGAMSDPGLVSLKAEGYDPSHYGGLFVFSVEGGDRFEPEPEGHDGAPILDASMDVVALVSAVTRDAGRTKILATPIQPLIPGTDLLLSQAPQLAQGGGARPRCSVAERVGEIDYNVSTHAVWNASRDQFTSQLRLTYDNIYSRGTISKVSVQYDFFGRRKKNSRYASLPLSGGDGNFDGELVLESIDPSSRQFLDSEVVVAGRNLSKKLDSDGGYISWVRLLITPTYSDLGVEAADPVEIGLAWSELAAE
ncbi:hypothetical protein [Frigidibacter sp. SD6-1]|uniref:hypothetical protein n=1 Tax=Frigidibacter sp. SD6-1 TaxID=3032581 RepID=UPI0024DFC784|nr:hypothetical protein [Frigidibacter sp. SD6-1]